MTYCWVIVDPPWVAWPPLTATQTARAMPRRRDAVVLVEVLVLRREHRLLHVVGHLGQRHGLTVALGVGQPGHLGLAVGVVDDRRLRRRDLVGAPGCRCARRRRRAPTRPRTPRPSTVHRPAQQPLPAPRSGPGARGGGRRGATERLAGARRGLGLLGLGAGAGLALSSCDFRGRGWGWSGRAGRGVRAHGPNVQYGGLSGETLNRAARGAARSTASARCIAPIYLC